VFQFYLNFSFPLYSGKWIGSRQIRCNWATKGASASDEKPSSDSKSVVELTNGTSGEIISLPYYTSFYRDFSITFYFLWFAVVLESIEF